jgi:hypothetical protein
LFFKEEVNYKARFVRHRERGYCGDGYWSGGGASTVLSDCSRLYPSSSLRPASNLYRSTIWRAGLWLRPRSLPGRCHRQPCHGKMVQDRAGRLPILLDAIARKSRPVARKTLCSPMRTPPGHSGGVMGACHYRQPLPCE